MRLPSAFLSMSRHILLVITFQALKSIEILSNFLNNEIYKLKIYVTEGLIRINIINIVIK